VHRCNNTNRERAVNLQLSVNLKVSEELTPDHQAFARELDELQASLRASAGPEDLEHLRKLSTWGRLASIVGYATAWVAPNPLSIFALSLGRFVRWTVVAHPVCHRGYEQIEGTPEPLRGPAFARGWRRPLDWFDWLDPVAWREEHNLQHHYRLNEEADPDLVERNSAWLRDSKLPRWLRLVVVAVIAMTWKFLYYAPNNLRVLARAEARRAGTSALTPSLNTQLWLRSWGPYLLVIFLLMPAAFLPLGLWAVASVLINSVLAELLTNVHAFVTIVPNHAGADLYRFEGRTRSRADFYLRQVLGSTNFRCGGDVRDLMHGWLNYQIEHHLWPDMSMLQYRRAQPKVREICERHGIPYVQESVWRRCAKAVAIIIGDDTMRRWPSR
jgi:fatty acid desaturase